jgi:hypothetical protein
LNAPVTVTAPTWPDAVIVVAPAVWLVAGLSVTVATPDASVKAVVAGATVARAVSIPKVTIALETAAPAAFFNVAFTVAGATEEIVVTAAPAALVSVSVMLGAAGPVVMLGWSGGEGSSPP